MFNEELDEAINILSLSKVDPRLDCPSELTPIKSSTKHMPSLDQQMSLPNPARYFHRQKSYMHEAVDNLDDLENKDLGGGDDLGGNDLGDDLDGDEINNDDIPGASSGSNYTIEMAKGQLDGIIGKWMDIAGNYPEGERRHKFLEIGERLREISAVIHRDYIENQSLENRA